MNIDEIKQRWNELSIKVTSEDLAIRSTSLDRLIDSYRRFAVLAMVCLPFGNSFLRLMETGELKATPWILILYYAVLLLSEVVDWTLFSRLKKIDVFKMSVSEVSERVLLCRKIHLISQLVLLPLGLAFVLVVTLSATDEYLRWGLICGASVGAVIGFVKWLQIMRAYRTLIAS